MQFCTYVYGTHVYICTIVQVQAPLDNVFSRIFRLHLQTTSRLRSCLFLFYGNYLFFAYMFIKIVYLCNVTLQLIWLSNFLGLKEDLFYGLE